MGARVGLGLPIYNGAGYVAAALDSLLAQSFQDFEIVISDNASSDDTEFVCRDYAKRDPRIHYHRNERNMGVAYNFRRVFELSRSQYFKWVVHDDVCDSTYLEKCVRTLDETPAAVLCYPKTILIDEHGVELGPYDDRMDLRQPRVCDRFAHLVRHLGFCHCVLGVIRSDVLRRTRLIDGFESSDLILLQELALLGEFREYPESLYRRRIHEDSSFQAYSSPEAYAERMDPANRGRIAMPRTRLFWESLRSIGRAPISPIEKLHCAGVLLGNWSHRYWRVVGGELRRFLRHWAGLAPSSRPVRPRPRRPR